MKILLYTLLVMSLSGAAFAESTILIPSAPPVQFTTEREYGALSKLTRTDGKDSVGYSFTEKNEKTNIVFSIGKDSVIRTVSSIEGSGPGIKVERKRAKICGQDCEYLNWKMNGYFYGATHVILQSKEKKKQTITVDVVALTARDLEQVEKDVATLTPFDTIWLR